jgi:hypothetical protein
VKQHVLAVARGAEEADLVLTGGRVVDVLPGTVVEADVAEGLIDSVGPSREAAERLDVAGRGGRTHRVATASSTGRARAGGGALCTPLGGASAA